MNVLKVIKCTLFTHVPPKSTHCRTKYFRQLLRRYCSDARRSDQKANNFYDVVICGGGFVGAALAAILAREPAFGSQRILLLEAGKQREMKSVPEKYFSRTCALSPATKQLLESIGAWDHVCNMRYHPWKKMQVWDSCSDAMITLNQDNLADDLAYLVENDVLLESINRTLKSVPNDVTLKYECQVKDFDIPMVNEEGQSESPWVKVHFDDGSSFQTRLLVGADGFRSQVRKSARIPVTEADYKQKGVVAILQISEPAENNVAWQRFLPTGPIAMLPISNSHSCLVWSTTVDDAKNLMELHPDSFVDAVNHAFWSEDEKDSMTEYVSRVFDGVLTNLGLDGSSSQQLPPTLVGLQEGSRASFPLGLCHATHYVKERVALIGDAAHRVHPLAGQGVNLGFGDVSTLRDVLVAAVSSGTDLGSIHHLLQYESERQCHVLPTIAVTDGLKRLYGTSWSPFVLVRSLGLQAVNAISPLKAAMVHHATK